MITKKIGPSWRIELPGGELVGWYMSEFHAKRGIEKRIREGALTPTPAEIAEAATGIGATPWELPGVPLYREPTEGC